MLKRVILDISKLNEGDRSEKFVDNTGFFVMSNMWQFINAAPIDVRRNQIEEDYIKSSFLITDNREAADLALHFGLGFSVYTNTYNRAEDFREALYCIDNISEMSDKNIERMYRRANDIPWDILETENFYLREIVVEDVDRLYEIYADEEVKRYIEDLYESKEEEIKYTQEYIKNQYRFYEYGMWIVIDKETNEIIGRAGIFDRAGQELTELGFVFAKDYWGKGVATEVLRAVIDYAHDELEISEMYAHVMNENERSKGLLEKLGFRYLKDVMLDGTSYKRYLYEKLHRFSAV